MINNHSLDWKLILIAIAICLLNLSAQCARVISIEHVFSNDFDEIPQEPINENLLFKIKLQLDNQEIEKVSLPISLIAWKRPFEQNADLLPVLANQQFDKSPEPKDGLSKGQFVRLLNLLQNGDSTVIAKNEYLVEIAIHDLNLNEAEHELIFEARAVDSFGHISSVITRPFSVMISQKATPTEVVNTQRTITTFTEQSRTKTYLIETPNGMEERTSTYSIKVPKVAVEERSVQLYEGGEYAVSPLMFSMEPMLPMTKIDPNIQAEYDRISRLQLHDRKRVQSVYFATNRELSYPNKQGIDKYGNEIGNRIHYGVTQVRIPLSHNYGKTIGTPRWSFLDDPRKHFKVDTYKDLNEKIFFESMRTCLSLEENFEEATQNDILVYVHGFRTTMKFSLLRLGQLAFDTGFVGRSCAFVWPSDGSALGYFDDRQDALASVGDLATFLKKITTSGSKGRVHIIAHSMGNYLTMQAIKKLHEETKDLDPSQQPRLGHVILAAPDVYKNNFHGWIHPVLALSKSVNHYHCTEDVALTASVVKNSHEIRAGLMAINQVGLNNVDCNEANTSFIGHNAYAEASPVLLDIQFLLQRDTLPSSRDTLIQIAEPSPNYYFYKINTGLVPKIDSLSVIEPIEPFVP